MKPSDVAVFYRTNAQSRVFEEVFIRTGHPYKVVGGVRFYERKEVRDALAYLRVLVNPEDTVSLRRILNVPKRGIGDRAEAAIEALAARDRISVRRRRCAGPRTHRRWPARSVNAVQAFVDILDELTAMVDSGAPPDDILDVALHRSGYYEELQKSTGSAGRDPAGEPGRVHLGGPGVRRGADRRRRSRPTCRRSSSGSRWSPTRTRSRTRPTTVAWSR